MTELKSLGIVGGTGELGGAIAPQDLWLSNRSGSKAGFEDWPGVNVTTTNQELADAADAVLLSVPPHLAADVGIEAPDRLVLSVMAGVTIEQLGRYTGARRVIRAMSSPAADIGLAYSPWCAGAGVTDEDRSIATALFSSCGLTDEVPNEDQIDRFTAITGPVPGFVAYFAQCMVDYAVSSGVDPAVADRAVRQLFHASGVVMAESDMTPGEQVRRMVDYAGTTAAGIVAMQGSTLSEEVAKGLDAAVQKAKTIA